MPHDATSLSNRITICQYFCLSVRPSAVFRLSPDAHNYSSCSVGRQHTCVQARSLTHGAGQENRHHVYICGQKKPEPQGFYPCGKNQKQSDSARLRVAACLVVTARISTEFLVNQNKPMTVSANQGESIVDIISFSSISNLLWN